jgi:hypothetical protein
MQNKMMLVMVMLTVMSGCTRIHFDNGEQVANTQNAQKKQWHHNAALSLYEVSEPVDLKKNCDGANWSSVETQLSFVNGLASTVVNEVAPLWYPKTVLTTCEKVQVPLQVQEK